MEDCMTIFHTIISTDFWMGMAVATLFFVSVGLNTTMKRVRK